MDRYRAWAAGGWVVRRGAFAEGASCKSTRARTRSLGGLLRPVALAQAGEARTAGNVVFRYSTPRSRTRKSRTAVPRVAPAALQTAVLTHRRGCPRIADRKMTTVAPVNTIVNMLMAVPAPATNGNHQNEAKRRRKRTTPSATPTAPRLADEPGSGFARLRPMKLNMSTGTATSRAAKPTACGFAQSRLALLMMMGSKAALPQGPNVPLERHFLQLRFSHSLPCLLRNSVRAR